MADGDASFARAEAQWTLDCEGHRQKAPHVIPGLYRVHWMTGGHSLAAIGCGYNGDNWIAPINWTRPSTIPALENGTWGLVKDLELIECDNTNERSTDAS